VNCEVINLFSYLTFTIFTYQLNNGHPF